MNKTENKVEFYERQEVKVIWENDGIREKNYGIIICKMSDLDISEEPFLDEWLVEIRDNKDEDCFRKIQVWEDEMFPIKEVK